MRRLRYCAMFLVVMKSKQVLSCCGVGSPRTKTTGIALCAGREMIGRAVTIDGREEERGGELRA